jgi:hypothetical protein
MHCFACKHGARYERLEIAHSNPACAQRFAQIRGKIVSAARESHCLDAAESGHDEKLEKVML